MHNFVRFLGKARWSAISWYGQNIGGLGTLSSLIFMTEQGHDFIRHYINKPVNRWEMFRSRCLGLGLKFHDYVIKWNIFRITGTCEGNQSITSRFPLQRPVTRNFDVFFDLRLNRQLSKQSKRQWFETPSRSLWRHCNVIRFGSANAKAFINCITMKNLRPTWSQITGC